MENTQNKPHRESLVLALLTSFGVAVAGAGLWGLLYTYGWFASFVAYFSAFGMIYCYKKFYKLNWFAYVWIAVVSIVLNTFACYMSLIINTMIRANCSFAVANQAIRSVWSEIAGEVIGDWIISAVFTGLGLFSYVQYERRNKAVQGGKTIRPTEYTEINENDATPNATTADATKTCPFCGSTMSADKTKCDSCGADLSNK